MLKNELPDNNDRQDGQIGCRTVLMLTADRRIDRRILLEADSLEKAGYSVRIVAMPADGVDYGDDQRIVRLQSDPESFQVENFVLRMYQLIRQRLTMNGPVMRLMKKIAWRIFIDQEDYYVNLFLPTVLSQPSDIIVAHDLPMLPVACLAAPLSGASVIYDSHELFSEQEYSIREKRRWSQIESQYIGQASAVITINHSIANELKSRYRLSDVQVIYNAEKRHADLTRTSIIRDRLNLGPDREILLFQGGVTAGRNLETLVAAMRYVTNPAISLVILGEGVLERTLKRYAHRHGLENRVHFLPAVSFSEIYDYTLSADAGVIPYQATCLNNYFCTPNKLFEFISACLPVVASDMPELRKIIQGENIGLVGDTTTPESFARLIDDLFADHQRIDEWREQLLRVREVINWDAEGAKIVDIYASVCRKIAESNLISPSEHSQTMPSDSNGRIDG